MEEARTRGFAAPAFAGCAFLEASESTLRGGPKDVKNSPWPRVQAGTSLLYFFTVVSTAVDSFPVAGGAALFFLHAVMEPVAIATASSISSNLAFMACLL